MIGDLPAMASSSYSASALNIAEMGINAAGLNQFQVSPVVMAPALRGLVPHPMQQPKKEKPAMVTRRLVQVFIADPDDNVPLNQSLLYSGQQKLTDATDQELFFEIDIKSILDNYNDERVKVRDKKVKERIEYLEPAKIRDLKMVVVNIATF